MADHDRDFSAGARSAGTPGTTGRSAQQTGGVVDQAKDKAGQVADQVQEKAGQVTDQAKDKAGQVTEHAKQQATSRLESGKERAVEGLGTVAHAVRQVGQQLREQEQSTAAQYADKSAEQIEHFSGYLRDKDVDQIVRETEGYARRQPTLFLSGALGLGFLLARFLKSSSQRAAAPGSASTRPYPPTPYTPTAESPAAGTRAHTPGYDAETVGQRPSPVPAARAGYPPAATGI
ncbi:MAG: hypothetical protein H0V51_09140 [Chloroflexi bacterium]|nr:hypothetical protein [Chloroflexota bacterium]